ncbi:hypothetical protein K2173_003985 [Erythroxylum novogranatense]|uniref:Uncharacterized protein n=1 Tax=Erythroxylum novogranatense TaxID=1862640 RepID=A0AAV8SJV7_9ROSI|nr:hypothetical protein K2173_003985 [Erythroxylum novogranatense]
MNPNSKPNSAISTVTATDQTTMVECGNCNAKDATIIHHVRLRGIYRRLCTSCVLRLHPTLFCPYCFSFYETTPPPPSKRITCSNCASFTHSHCSPPPPSSTPFLCPPCSSPNFSFFTHSAQKVIDQQMAVTLLCAARIASASMAKAVVVARAEAERRGREAALCRKRAKEALEHLTFLFNNNNHNNINNTNNKFKKKDSVAQVSPLTNGGVVNDNVSDNLKHDASVTKCPGGQLLTICIVHSSMPQAALRDA